jgi:hypothetical protein
MAYLNELNQWDAGVYRLERTDPAEGGESGKANAPLKNLANRTTYLKSQVDALNANAQVNGQIVSAATGSSDAIIGVYSPAIAALTNGMILFVRAASANTTTTPTFTPNSGVIAAKTIVKGANSALFVGDIAGAGNWLELQYDSMLDKWVLLNPALGIARTQINQILLTSGTSWTTPNNITPSTVFKLTLIGPGGGGGGAATGYSGDGGQAGGTTIDWVSGLMPSTPYAYTIGAGAPGGIASLTTGGAGGSAVGSPTTITIGGTTYSAGGGHGGSGHNSSSTTNYTGGAGGICANGTIQIPGQPGGFALNYDYNVSLPGCGGSTPYGMGGVFDGTTALDGTGYGSGGSGGYGRSGGSSGGNIIGTGGSGANGCILIEWSN